MPHYTEKIDQITLPVIPIGDAVAFPPFPIGIELDDKVVSAAIEAAGATGMLVFLVSENDELEGKELPDTLFSVGTIAKIRQSVKNDNGTNLLCECRSRAIAVDYKKTGKVITASLIAKEISLVDNGGLKGEAYCRELRHELDKMLGYVGKASSTIREEAKKMNDPALLCDFIASSVLVRFLDKRAVLAEFDPFDRADILLNILRNECDLMRYENEIQEKTRARVAQNQREYYLREQLKALEDELGMNEEDPDDCTKKIREADVPDEVREKLFKENDRLSKTPFGSAEAAVLRNYIETVLELPWNKRTADRVSVAAAKKILDADHDGMKKVKERILEYLAVKQLSPDLKNQIICLVGPPGTGKTSIAASIANAMNRKYIRVSLGGIHDESDIRGHRKTYVASMPGRIMAAMEKVGVKNPLMLLDEIDKLTSDSRGDPASALLEVLDPEQNKTFRDHFIELDFDLSECLFITTANTLDTIPRPLLDRMEVIELSSYTRREKLSIARNHLLPKQSKRHGLDGRKFRMTDDALYEIIDCYVREAGVRNLERTIAQLCRKVAKKLVESEGTIKRIVIDKKDIASYLGGRKILPELSSKEDLVGVVNGLAYTEVGGDLLKVEVAVLDGTGKLELTGSLGDVMKESAKAALTYIRSIASKYGIPTDFYKTKDIHIHVPEGAVPKDGPSAGVTMTTALCSALSGIPVRHDVAMTGEVTLTGRVLAIGGLREKTMAAYAAGVKTVLIPADNEGDLEEVDEEVRANIKFITCRRAEEVLAHALVSAPSDEIFTENGKNEDGFESTLSGVIVNAPAAEIPAIRGKEHGN